MIAILKESLQLFDEIIDSWTSLDKEDNLPDFLSLDTNSCMECAPCKIAIDEYPSQGKPPVV
jgi:hypothetical protein